MMRYTVCLGIALIVMAMSGCAVSGGGGSLTREVFEAMKPSDNKVFKSYQIKGKSSYANNWTSGVDLTGVSWNNPKTATMVSPIHFVCAAHYSRNVGEMVVFHEKSGERVERFVVKLKKIARSDVAVGLLNRPVPRGIRYYPVPRAGQEQILIGRSALVTEQKKRLFRHQISRINGQSLSLGYQLEKGLNKRLISGDSGNPSFYISGSQLVLVETHTGGGPGVGPYYGDAELIEKINVAMSSLQGGYQLQLVNLR